MALHPFGCPEEDGHTRRGKVVDADRPRGVVDELHESSTLMLHCQGATVVQIHIHSRADMVAPIRAWRDGQTQATKGDSIVVGHGAPIVAGKDMLRRQFLGPGAESWFRKGRFTANPLWTPEGVSADCTWRYTEPETRLAWFREESP